MDAGEEGPGVAAAAPARRSIRYSAISSGVKMCMLLDGVRNMTVSTSTGVSNLFSTSMMSEIAS